MKESDPRLTPARPDLAAAHLEGRVEAPSYVRGETRRVCLPATPLRRHPRADAGLDTELLCGELFTVYEEKEGWAWGQAAFDGYVGYVSAAALGALEPEPGHRVSALRTYVYPVPNLKSPPLALLSMNAKVCIQRPGAPFCAIAFGGAPGHVFAGHLAPLNQRAPDHAGIAEMFLGTPYLWGGRQSLGLDCSALVQNALERTGVAAPRDTDMQAENLGEAVSGAPLQTVCRRGDLAFWKGHVGIMVDAHNMIHANATAMAVSVDSLASFAAAIEPEEGPIVCIRRLT